ncbi:MAG: phasin family protein [Gammaproteobacteria bacterium]|nr:phasin family protein [Gammaproteobacteria bacterium]
MNQYLNQFTNDNFVETANQIMRKNYELVNELYAKQVQFAQDAAKSGVENLQRFRDAKNAADILNAQSACWMSSMQAVVNNFQSTMEIMNPLNKTYSEAMNSEVQVMNSVEPKQKPAATRKQKPTAIRKKTAKKTAKKTVARKA